MLLSEAAFPDHLSVFIDKVGVGDRLGTVDIPLVLDVFGHRRQLLKDFCQESLVPFNLRIGLLSHHRDKVIRADHCRASREVFRPM